MKTKNISIYLLMVLLLSITGLTSCKKFLDDAAVNPNSPEEVSPQALLASIELSTFFNYGGGISRRTAIFTQHMAGADGQYVGLANYNLQEGDVDNEWSSIYTGALMNSKILMDKLGDASPNFKGIAEVLFAMNLGLTTDLWGDIPNSDAFQALSNNNFAPKYDSQEKVLIFVQDILSKSIVNLQQPSSSNAIFAGESADFIFKGDTKKWLGVAYALKARYANHLSKINPSQSAIDAIDYLNLAKANGFDNGNADANAVFGDAKGNENNLWYAFQQERGGYIKMGKFFVEMMKTYKDPRLSFFAEKDLVSSGYTGVGLNPTTASGKESNIGAYYGSIKSKSPIITYVETKFIEAECKLRINDAAGAATANNDAVMASLLQVTGTLDSLYVANHAKETAATITLEKIMIEKYVALFTQAESWNDFRRTGFPSLTPNPGGAVTGIPRIFPTPLSERNNNPNAIIVTNILQRVWWDK